MEGRMEGKEKGRERGRSAKNKGMKERRKEVINRGRNVSGYSGSRDMGY